MRFSHPQPNRAQHPNTFPKKYQNTINKRPEIATAGVTTLVLNGARVLNPQLSFGALCLLARLCEFVFEPRRWDDPDVIITPANARIARSLVVSERTIRRFLLELENAGWILRHYSPTNRRHGGDAGINLRPVAARLEALRQIEQAMRATPRKNGSDEREEAVDNSAPETGSGRTNRSPREDRSVHLVIPYRISHKKINVPHHARREEGRVETANTARPEPPRPPEPQPEPGPSGLDDGRISGGQHARPPEKSGPSTPPELRALNAMRLFSSITLRAVDTVFRIIESVRFVCSSAAARITTSFSAGILRCLEMKMPRGFPRGIFCVFAGCVPAKAPGVPV